MEGIFLFVIQNPAAILVVVALGLACLFAWLLFGSFKDRVSGFETTVQNVADRMTVMSESTKTQFSEMRDAIHFHSDSMGKATKAIAGDMLKVQEKVFELKQDLIGQVGDVKLLSEDTRRNLELANSTSKMALENLNEKLGRVILIEQSSKTHDAQIEKLQTGVGENQSSLAKHGKWFATIAEALKKNKERLEALERNRKKDSKDEL